jgi:hypothetical protein
MFELRSLEPTDAEQAELVQLYAFLCPRDESTADAEHGRMVQARSLPRFAAALVLLGADSLAEHLNVLPLRTPRCPDCGYELLRVTVAGTADGMFLNSEAAFRSAHDGAARCAVESPGYICTRIAGHHGAHHLEADPLWARRGSRGQTRGWRCAMCGE